MPSRKPLPAVLPWLTALTAAPLVLIVAAVALVFLFLNRRFLKVRS